ncbi:MAG: type II secretion system minor pseudopilin GspK [Cellvibrionales bacterium]|nr:type II secretion system minor pseudopilin GspK [Cellvibrionales bacterium]
MPSPAPTRQSGMALLVTLIMITVMLAVLTSIAYRQALDFKRSSRALLADQILLLALSGESWSKKILLDDAADNSSDSLEDDWAQLIPALPVEGGQLSGCILDLHGRFNLNNLATYTAATFKRDLADEKTSNLELYLNLLALLELDYGEERAARVIDWLDADRQTVAPGSSEDDDYAALRPPRLAANQPFGQPSELVMVAGYNAADWAALHPHVTALPTAAGKGATRLNINTASRPVLRALFANVIDEYAIDTLMEERPFESIGEFYALAADQLGYLTEAELRQRLPSALFGTRSEYFALHAQVSLAGSEVALSARLHRTGNQVKTLSRSFAYIPRLELLEGQADPLLSPCQNHRPSDEPGFDLESLQATAN